MRTFEIIQQVINSMDLTIHVNDVNGTILYVCETLHIRKDSVIKDDLDNEYRVVSFVNNESVEILPLGAYTWSGKTIYCPEPTFLQGKWISANNEYLAMTKDTRQKTPLIWLVRGYEEDHLGEMHSAELKVEPMMFFLDEADFNEWLNEDHDKEAVNPMYNLAIRFVETIQNDENFDDLDNWKIKDEPRFGVKTDKNNKNKGNSKRILSDDLSGVGLKIPLKIFNNCQYC